MPAVAPITDPGPSVYLRALNPLERDQVFGHIAYVSAGVAANPEAIKITNNWVRDNIVTTVIPQLTTIPGIVYRGVLYGTNRTGQVQAHRAVVKDLLSLWNSWETAGLLSLILTWDGMWVPRFIRGSKSILSNHAYGAAFDINASFNALGKVPAERGEKGSVRELVTIANDWGWYWGGHFPRMDGMHFECGSFD